MMTHDDDQLGSLLWRERSVRGEVFIEKCGVERWRLSTALEERRGKEYTLHRVVEPLPLTTGELV